jgi:hypothetical protein
MVIEEPPLSEAEAIAAKVSRGLLFVLCAAPIALFPLGLAYRVFVHFFP